jgi:hypothetical protein
MCEDFSGGKLGVLTPTVVMLTGVVTLLWCHVGYLCPSMAPRENL